MENKTNHIAVAPKSFDATSFFEHPTSFSGCLNKNGVQIPFTVTRNSFGVEGCQSHNITLSLDDFPVTVSFIVLTRNYGQKEAYNRAQLRIMDDVWNCAEFLEKVAVIARKSLSIFEDNVSFFFMFERNGLSNVSIYLTAKASDMYGIERERRSTICTSEPVSCEDAQELMLNMMSGWLF